PGQPLPREGLEDGPAGLARGSDAGPVCGRHGRGRRRRPGLRHAAAGGPGTLRVRQRGPARRAARGPRQDRAAPPRGLWPRLSNSLRWLHPAALDQSSLQLAAGQPILLPVAHGVTSVSVTTPHGRVVKALVTRGMVSFTDTDEVGVYTLSSARGETRVAVNLMDAEESNLQPRPLPAFSGPPAAAPAPVPIQRELWPLFVLIAALLLAVEGLLYWRR